MSSPKVTRISVTIAGETKSIAVGAFAQIAAKRRFGMDVLRDGDPEPVLWGVWIELEGPRPRGERVEVADEAFDQWLRSVEHFELEQAGEAGDDDDADPTPAEQSGSSLDSPPTSE